MPPKTIANNVELGEIIKNRRNELNLTIEAAASKAGIGTKTWSRYESGESIRRDKVSGLCKAMKWKTLPEMDDTDIVANTNFDEYRKSEAWSPYLEGRFGKYAALSFVIGSDILLDEINEDISALSAMPRGSHVGEVPTSLVSDILPEQFLMRYDYEFMLAFRQTVINFRKTARYTECIKAHSVIEELVLYLIVEESRFLMEEIDLDAVYENDEIECGGEDEEENQYEYWDGWAFDIFDDMDVVTFLYSDIFTLTSSDGYHFDNWFK